MQKVTIAPHQKLPLGHMILDLNEGRELTGLFTRRYLLQQLRLVLAGERADVETNILRGRLASYNVVNTPIDHPQYVFSFGGVEASAELLLAALGRAPRLPGHGSGSDVRPRCPTTGRAAEEILYGRDEMSTINQRQLTLARRVAQKLVVSGGLSDARGLGPSPITHPVPMGGTLGQIVPQRVSNAMTRPRGEAGRRAQQSIHLRFAASCEY